MSAEDEVVEEQPESKSTIPEGYVSPSVLSEDYVSKAAHNATMVKLRKQKEEAEAELQALRDEVESRQTKKNSEPDKLKEFEAKWEETRYKPLADKLSAERGARLDSEIESALLAAGAPAGILDPKSENHSPRIKKLLRSSFEYNDDYGYFVAHDDSGNPVYGGTDPQRPYAGVKEYVLSLKDDPLFAGVFAPKTITGSSNYRGGNGKQATSKHTKKELMANKKLYSQFMQEERAAGRNARESFANLPRE